MELYAGMSDGVSPLKWINIVTRRSSKKGASEFFVRFFVLGGGWNLTK